eukprot:COSAG01_NODE_3824_length_5658_cov_8.480482_9_plen_89_part_00
MLCGWCDCLRGVVLAQRLGAALGRGEEEVARLRERHLQPGCPYRIGAAILVRVRSMQNATAHVASGRARTATGPAGTGALVCVDMGQV